MEYNFLFSVEIKDLRLIIEALQVYIKDLRKERGGGIWVPR